MAFEVSNAHDISVMEVKGDGVTLVVLVSENNYNLFNFVHWLVQGVKDERESMEESQVAKMMKRQEMGFEFLQDDNVKLTQMRLRGTTGQQMLLVRGCVKYVKGPGLELPENLIKLGVEEAESGVKHGDLVPMRSFPCNSPGVPEYRLCLIHRKEQGRMR